MVEILVDLDKSGQLHSLHIEGHAGLQPKGANLACAVISFLARSVSRLLHSRLGEDVQGSAGKSGLLHIDIRNNLDTINPWLVGVTDILLQGLADIEKEFPEAASIEITEEDNGS